MQTYCLLENHSREVNCCAFSDEHFVTCSGDKTLRVYSAHAYHELPYSPVKGFKYGINYLDFTSSGNLLAAGSSDGSAYIFRFTDTTAEPVSRFCHSDTTTVEVCSFSNSSMLLVTGSHDGSIAMWDVGSKKLVRRATGHPEGNVYAAAFTPCDCFMVTGSGLGDLRVWDLSSFEVSMQTQAHDEGVSSCGVTCVKFSPSLHSSVAPLNRTYLLASCGQDNKVKLWFFHTQNKRIELNRVLSNHHAPVSRCAFSPDGLSLASCSYDKSIILWDPNSGEQQLELFGHTSFITSVAFSVYGHLASTSFDKTARIWRRGVNRVFSETFKEEKTVEQNITSNLIDVSQTAIKPSSTSSFSANVETWSCDDVGSWLNDRVNLGQYVDKFKTNHIDGTELKTLTLESLQKDLGIGPLGHRNKILRAIQQLYKAT